MNEMQLSKSKDLNVLFPKKKEVKVLMAEDISLSYCAFAERVFNWRTWRVS